MLVRGPADMATLLKRAQIRKTELQARCPKCGQVISRFDQRFVNRSPNTAYMMSMQDARKHGCNIEHPSYYRVCDGVEELVA